jgi:transcriptional regulator with XRE-family HTH domain
MVLYGEPMFLNEDLAALLEGRRKELGLGHRSLADRSRTPRSSIKRYLEDPESMRFGTLCRVLAALDLTLTDITALESRRRSHTAA